MQDRAPKMNGRNQKVYFDLSAIGSWDDFVAANAAGTLYADVLANTLADDGADIQGTPLGRTQLFGDDAERAVFGSATGDHTVSQGFANLGRIVKNVTLAAESWSGNAYQITSTDFAADTSTLIQYIEVSALSTTSASNKQAFAAAKITGANANGTLTLTAAGTVPTVDIPITITIERRVKA